MKKVKLILAISFIGFVGMSNAQSLKEKMQAKLDAKAAKSKNKPGKEKMYDFSDESGISGTYYTNEQIIDRQSTIGFKFTKEKDGEIINQLYVELGGKGYGGRPNSITCKLKEKYKTKYGFNYFYMTDKDCPNLANNRDSWVFMEVATGIYAYAQNDKVLCVAAKDKASFTDYDTETAQVLFDQKRGQINAEAMEKETAKWMKNAIYSKNVGKIVFSNNRGYLMKRGYTNKPPMVDGKGFKTVLDMGSDMVYMAFFKFPPSEQFAGQEINIEYEMGGIKTSRTESKAKSAAWSSMVKRLETKDFAYRQHSPRSLREKTVQDYAFVECLYAQKEKFKVDGEYEMTVKMYSSRDGENGELLAEGVVKLKYTAQAVKEFEGDLDKAKIGVWAHFEEFLDE